MTLQPTLHRRVLVRGVVVRDQVQVEFLRRAGVDLFEELDPLLVTVPFHALIDNDALGQLPVLTAARVEIAQLRCRCGCPDLGARANQCHKKSLSRYRHRMQRSMKPHEPTQNVPNALQHRLHRPV